jgi:hypothetical protein
MAKGALQHRAVLHRRGANVRRFGGHPAQEVVHEVAGLGHPAA